MRTVLISLSLAAAALSTSGALAAQPHAQMQPARVSPYSPEGLAIQAQIKKLDRSIRFQQRMSNERAARMNGADTDRYVVYSPYGGYGGYGAYGGYGGGYRVGYFPSSGSLSYSPGLGIYSYRPGLSAASPGPNNGTVKYRRLVQERADLQARLAPL